MTISNCSRALITSLFCLILFLQPAELISAVSDSGAEKFMSATELINNGRYPEAIGLYNDIVTTSPHQGEIARAILFTGVIYDLYLDQPEMALQQFEKIYNNYQKSPAAADALYNSGRIKYKQDRYKEAVSFFSECINKYPGDMRRNSAEIWLKNARDQIPVKPKPEPVILKQDLNPEIRVLLKKRAGRYSINSPATIRIRNFNSGKTIFYGEGPVVVSSKENKLTINTEKTSATACRVETSHEYISVGGKRYRGSFVMYVENKGLTLVNHIHVEKYLYGVVPKEMSWLWSFEALKAQAISSRTYALYIREKQQKGMIYDLTATTASQVYGGHCAEKEQTNKAVDETKGKVMLYDGKLIIAYFHANSGGYTESSENVWGADIPYLRSVPDKFSSTPEENTWRHTLSCEKLGRLLSKTRFKSGRIKRIQAAERSASGRIKSFYIFTKKEKLKIGGNHFRMRVGATELKSTWFKIIPNRKRIVFEGKGYGHGVGMSQWGAHQMALFGQAYGDILKHYYQNVEIFESGYTTIASLK